MLALFFFFGGGVVSSLYHDCHETIQFLFKGKSQKQEFGFTGPGKTFNLQCKISSFEFMTVYCTKFNLEWPFPFKSITSFTFNFNCARTKM